MGPFSTESDEFFRIAEQWITPQKELFVDYYRPHSGGGPFWYFIYDLNQLHDLISQAHGNAVITVVRLPQLQLRGVVDENFIVQAVSQFKDGQWWVLTEPTYYPESLAYEADDTTEMLKKTLLQMIGKKVWLGPEPSYYDTYWVENDDPDVIIARKPMSA